MLPKPIRKIKKEINPMPPMAATISTTKKKHAVAHIHQSILERYTVFISCKL